MRRNDGVFIDDDTDVRLHEERSGDDGSVACLEMPNGIAREQAEGRLQLAVDAELMDRLAIAWCRHRKLHGALGGPVGRELGSPDCEYD